MPWSRKYFDQWEWYHRPVSPMEESLLLPEHINSALKLISKRLGLKFPNNSWKVINGYLYTTGNYRSLWFQPGIVLLPIRFLREVKPARLRWINEVLPDYQKQVKSIKETNIKHLSNNELIRLLELGVKLEGKLMAEAVYVVLFAIFAELLLKLAYGPLINDNQKWHYRELLIGFPDLGIEGDVKLWEIAHSSPAAAERKLDKRFAILGFNWHDPESKTASQRYLLGKAKIVSGFQS